MAAFSTLMRRATLALALVASLAAASIAHASDMTADWPAWNAASPPIFPSEITGLKVENRKGGWIDLERLRN
ncbi:hypothetical protein [Nisaea sp.]|uniref:hypothetical protein n=1 Tax=Nisaea sp. TaxID=2024842 RepID=UPI002B26A13E|nr:hypothetical protein [Nisaea sp.]